MTLTSKFTDIVSIKWQNFQDKIRDPKSQRRLVLVIVCIALLLDNMLYMVIVPIIPNYLTRDQKQDEPTYLYKYYNVTESSNAPVGATHSYVMAHKLDTNGQFENGAIVNVPEQAILATNTSLHTEKHDNRIMLLRIAVPPPPISYGDEGIKIGVLFASKAIFQLCVNPFTGGLIDRIGYDIPMMIGLTIMFLSTSVFAFGESYAVLFLARSLQGLGSAFADTSGLAMIADRFTEEAERSKSLGIALAFISFGCLFAPPFGGILYEFTGKTAPFVILALVCLIDGILMVLVMKPVRLERSMLAREERPNGTPIWKLLMDPYIAVAAGALAMSNVSLAFLEPTISLWMKVTMGADEWQIGFCWLPSFVTHVLGVYMTVKLARKFPQYQWLMAMIGLSIEGIFCFFVPFSTAYFAVIFPIMGICFGIALVDTALLPTLGYLVDVRHVSVYGSVYAIADISYSLAYAIGPIVAGSIVSSIGFMWLNVLIFLSNILYAPLLIFLRNIYMYKPFDNDDEVLIDDPPPKGYNTYVQNGGLTGKPLALNGGDNFANHLKISNRKSNEIDCYPPPTEPEYVYHKDSSYNFYNQPH
ncbi:probable vesicular acetylcholine transporter-B [Physella acuta]|uniref:probable vesicular acetylcholine transporter-B n=1 Tax=Physella acuta TaxID=109671 RepID=UPI0027DB9EC2|nr:probable vesicular acetylcholine transporter-B [Physella acuta]XP_059166135.1 probable vesicular acetylcholine transporter-B [Physella acuta]XP_059166136.1 probable vesicular acetylcholine transporter-B [Physella acuta]